MRFVAVFLFIFLCTAQWVWAKPGQNLVSADKRLSVPEGFQARQIRRNANEITAIAAHQADLYTLSAGGDKIFKYSDRNKDNVFETRSVYLIGFNGLSDIISTSSHLYIADKNGIWQVSADRGLVARDSPRKLLSLKSSSAKLAFNSQSETLYAGFKGRIFSLNLASGHLDTVARGDWTPTAMAVSPNGGLWAGLQQKGQSAVVAIGRDENTSHPLKLKPGALISDLHFFRPVSFPANWPREWKTQMLIAQAGTHPAINRVGFEFGEISKESQKVVGGFSRTSHMIGRNTQWGAPSALAILPNGCLVFSVPETASLFMLEKIVPAPSSVAISAEDETNTIQEKRERIGKKPTLIRGSSIKTVSGITSGSMLENDELLRGKPPIEAEPED